MKLVCLNIWGGKLFLPLMEYVKSESATTDIFCFQEVFDAPGGEKEFGTGERGDTLRTLKEILADFDCVFIPVLRGWGFEKPVDFELSYGQATFVRKGITIKEQGDVMVYREKDMVHEGEPITEPKSFVYVRIGKSGKEYMVLNLHGALTITRGKGGPKTDNPARVAQALKIKSFAEAAGCPVIICGDWNLLPNEPSLRMLEDAGFENLVRSFRITKTRNDHYPGMKKFNDYLGDYLLASGDIDIKNFDVPAVGVSDHEPLVFEFD